MRKFYWVVVYLTVLLMVFSCVQKPATGPISVKVNVNLPAGTTVKDFEPRLNGYISDISVITLTVKKDTGEIVLSTETTNKTNPSFTFTLPSVGNTTSTLGRNVPMVRKSSQVRKRMLI